MNSIDKRKITALRLSERGIDCNKERLNNAINSQFSSVFEDIGELADEFQKKYCPDYINYNLENKTFLERSLNNSDDCKWHYIDIIGNCHNYQPRGEKK